MTLAQTLFPAMALVFLGGCTLLSRKWPRMPMAFGIVAVLLAGAALLSLPVLAVGGGALAVIAIRRWRTARRRPTRNLSDMDHDVQERIRAIAAESRYSSAGIEF
ncbi:hypothetical protein [Roseobacter ponti]|uniref:Uncharacterized protein n=1 Tax=Roseobacter ponti TaxID=1891787 RepID=A0A858SNT9_9RHOB|nr:hypothetical protein [Roseobacter ponti]QJF50090.1 hypothetical protein G3256_02355 [Roseobacter ponti]